jgi:hypothetical protein
MGIALPLPDRIPLPNNEQLLLLNEMGINIENNESEQYVKYSLPFEWKMIDSSLTPDLPNFYILDDKYNKRVNIKGTWRGSYDNNLNLYIFNNIEEYNKDIIYIDEILDKIEYNIQEDNEESDINIIDNNDQSNISLDINIDNFIETNDDDDDIKILYPINNIIKGKKIFFK